MTALEILSQKTAGGTGSLFNGLKNFFSTDAGDTSVSNSERWVFMGCRFIFHIAAAICTFYAPMKILPEPFMEVFPESGYTIAVALSCVFVFAVEFFTYSIARRATINSLKLAKEEFQASVLGNTLLWTVLSIAIGYFSWACAQSGAENIAFQKTDKSGQFTASKDVKVDILKSDYKELVKTTTTTHDKSIRESELALATYQKRKWTDPKTLDNLSNNIESARKAKDKALDKIKEIHSQDLADQDNKAKPLLEQNAAKQSMYQQYIPFVSLMVEFGKFIFIFLLVQLGYKSGGQKPQQRRQKYTLQEEPQIFVEKKSPIQIQSQPIHTPIMEEMQPQMSRIVQPIADDKDWIGEYVKLMKNRASFASRIRNADKQGNYDSALKSWLNNEPLIEAACNALNRAYDRPKQPINTAFVQTNP